MKILESYKKMAKSMLIEYAWDRKFGEPLPTLEDVMREAEVDDKKMIKYKDKDGEAKEMAAGSAKTMEKDHPAKIAYDKMADTGGEEEPKSKGLGKGDFERDFDDDSETGKDYVSKFQGTDEPEDDEYAISGTDSDDPAGGKGDAWMHGDDEEAAKAQAMKDMEDEFDMEEETIEINGKQYKEVKEEKKVTKKHILREMYEKMGGK